MCFFRKKKEDNLSTNNKESKNYKVPKFEKLKKEEVPQLFEEFSKHRNQSSTKDEK